MQTMAISINELLNWLAQFGSTAQLCSDSRQIRPGDIFCAFPAAQNQAGDGRQHIRAAIANGAAAVVYEEQDHVWDDSLAVPHRAVCGLAQQAGLIAHAWYGAPDQSMLTLAVTGTNGKTSCSQWLAKAFSLLGKESAVIGTLGMGTYRDGNAGVLQETGYTTPDALTLQRTLAQLRDAGTQVLAIEASSIGLQQGRLNGMHVDLALFTNLTRDHLDYHGDMQHYAAAKQILFDWPGLRTAVINLDDGYGQQVAAALSAHADAARVIGYSLEAAIVPGLPDVEILQASHIRTTHSGTSFHVDSSFGSGLVKTRLIGRFNVSNILGVLAALLSEGVTWNKAVALIEKLTPVAGRMQLLGTAGHVMVVVDYAHTPDALEQTLAALQEVAHERHGQLWCVFGCGGDRDPGKRPQMGKIAGSAQHVVVTSDNPRTEKPSAIIQDILRGMDGAPLVIEDRAAAILYAVKHAGHQDVVLIAGKGHETYQDIQGKKWPFSDEQHAALALATVATSNISKREPS